MPKQTHFQNRLTPPQAGIKRFCKRFCRAQVTVFMILAIVIVVIGIFYYISPVQKIKQGQTPEIPSQRMEFSEVRQYLQSCFDEAGAGAVSAFASAGNPQAKSSTNEEPRARAIFSDQRDVPDLKKALDLISDDFRITADDCLIDVEESMPYKIAPIQFDSKAESTPSEVIITTTSPIKIQSQGIERELGTFLVRIPYPLEDYLTQAKAGVTAFTIQSGYVNMSTFIEMDSRYRLEQLGENIFGITLISNDYPMTSYSFAVKVPT